MTRIELRSGARPAADPGRQRSERAGGGRGRGVGRQPPRRHAVADRPRHEHGRVDRRHRQRPDRGRRRRGLGLGRRWRGGHRPPRRSATGRAWSSGSRPGAARRRSRSPAGRCGRPRTPRSPRIAGGRCTPSCRTDPGAGPDRLAALRRVHIWATSQLSSLAYDGLVAYRRVEGPAGATLVGALATSAPAPSRRREDLRVHAASRVALLRRQARSGPPTCGPRWSAILRHERAPGGPGAAVLRGHRRRPEVQRRPGAVRASRGDRDRRAARARSRSISLAPTRTSCTSSRRRSRTSCRPTALAAPSRGRTPPGTGPYRVATWDCEAGRGARPQPVLPVDAGAPLGPGFADRIDVGTYYMSRRRSRRSPPSSAAPRT